MVNASSGPAAGQVRAVLGPTNTGKTHLAVERMLGHASGIIGLPLRLLAREVYDRVVALRGAKRVALITGEEKIVPDHPAYFVCTVESMPLDRQAAFLAVDEIQLARDRERGHVFTDRLLRARGTEETLFLGSDTMRPLIRKLVPEAAFTARPRFSRLTYAGTKKLSRLKPRTAIVTFSVDELYAIAELVRRQRGGAAVVLGALSPRTRNAQVALFESGEVDYMVATDAIGMGLNMDIDHVAFASLRKFDGRAMRALDAAELAQIAGRAGRHMSDGTFGTTADAGEMRAEDIEQIETHAFEPVRALYWRNAELEFTSLDALVRSLESPAPLRPLMRVPGADDTRVLKTLVQDPAIAERVSAPAAVRLLWEVCQVPDFRKTMADAHARLLGQIYRHLTGPEERLPHDWVAGQLARLERTDGDIDTLSARIAHVRTWTYVSHRPDWTADARHWQERARAIEDKLSDALHERLTQRFFDRRIAVLARRLKDRSNLVAAVAEDGEVLVEGISVGRLAGLRFVPDPTATGPDSKALRTAANRALNGAAAARAQTLAHDDDAAFALTPAGQITWRGAPVARLKAGHDPLTPRVALLVNDLLDGPAREEVRRRAQLWLDDHIANVCAPLFRLRHAKLGGAARGLAYHLSEVLGMLARRAVVGQLRALDGKERAKLRRLGVRFGETSLYLPTMLRPERRNLAGLLWSTHAGHLPPPEAPAPGLVSAPVTPGVPEAFYGATGFCVVAGRAVRIDMLERLAAEARRRVRTGRFASSPELMSLVGCRHDDFRALLRHLGYHAERSGDEVVFARAARRNQSKTRKSRAPRKSPQASPFARLRELDFGAGRRAE